MRTILKRFIIIAAILLAGFGVYYYYYQEHHKDDGAIVLYGNVDIRDVNLGFRVFGRLDLMKFEEGDRVKKGDILCSLDKAPYSDLLQAAKADLEDKTEALKTAQQVFDRKKELIKTHVASQQTFDDSLALKNRATAALHVSEANLADANIKFADTDVLSPADGTILTRVREPGSIVNPGESIYVLALDDPIWVRAYISEMDLGKVFPGMKAKIYSDSQPDKYYEGQIGFISPQAEFTPKTVETTELRTKLVYRLRITIDNKDRYLRQGMPVTIKIEPRDAHDKN
jgi:HlyD family secretion protein